MLGEGRDSRVTQVFVSRLVGGEVSRLRSGARGSSRFRMAITSGSLGVCSSRPRGS
jgi:hypothetical protein